MSRQFVVLCEDKQQSVFICRFLKREGIDNRDIREAFLRGGKGSGAKWVLDRYSDEIDAARKHKKFRLVVMIDGDDKGVEVRLNQLAMRLNQRDQECGHRGFSPRTDVDCVAVFVPTRNIETWLYFLDGGDNVDESATYPKKFHRCERKCQPMVDAFREMCLSGNLPDEAPSSLRAACEEYNKRRNSLLGES